MSEKIKKEITDLSPTHLGYFGEEVFIYYTKFILNKDIEKVHKEGKDFEIDGVKIDVGTRRPLSKKKIGRKISKKDAFVFFYLECCYIDYPNKFFGEIQWEKVAILLKDYKQKKKIKINAIKEKSFKSEYYQLESKIKNYFSKNGCESNIIHRTVSGQFGLRESPGNLLLKKFKDDGIKVYIDFFDFRRTIENINFIIAFPESMEMEIPKQKKVSLKSGDSDVKKVDLVEIQNVNHRCYFVNYEDLTKNFFMRYKKNGKNWL
jgi:hypothetical protein